MIEKYPYPYANGELLENRHTYQYTEFKGKEFISAWKEMCNDICRKENSSLGEIIELRKHLDRLMERLIRGDIENNDFKSLLNMWVQKFEVTKRLFVEYDLRFKPLDIKAYHDIRLYLRYAEVMAYAYKLTSNLPYLNVLLKVMDTLIAYKSMLNNEEKKRFVLLVEQQVFFIDRLAENLDVTI
jgi:hypothetical protein